MVIRKCVCLIVAYYSNSGVTVYPILPSIINKKAKLMP